MRKNYNNDLYFINLGLVKKKKRKEKKFVRVKLSNFDPFSAQNIPRTRELKSETILRQFLPHSNPYRDF